MKAQKVSDILRKLRSIPGCKIPPIVCKCCNGDCAGAGGWHFSDKIVICTNSEKKFANINVIDILGHELTHRLQKCQNRYGGGCLNSLKNEVEAYSTHIRGCSNIIEHAKQSVLLGGQCSKAELTADVIQKATEYCKSIN